MDCCAFMRRDFGYKLTWFGMDEKRERREFDQNLYQRIERAEEKLLYDAVVQRLLESDHQKALKKR